MNPIHVPGDEPDSSDMAVDLDPLAEILTPAVDAPAFTEEDEMNKQSGLI